MLTKVAYSKNTENIQKILFKMDLFYLNMFYNVIYSCDGKTEFSAAITSVFCVTYPSEITLIWWFGAQEILSLLETAQYFCGHHDTFYFIYFFAVLMTG